MPFNTPTFPDVFDEFSQLPIGVEVCNLPTLKRATDLARCFQDLTQLPADCGWRCLGVKNVGGRRRTQLDDIKGGRWKWIYGVGHAEILGVWDDEIAKLTSPMQVKDLARTILTEVMGQALAIPE